MKAKKKSRFDGIPGYASPEEGLKALLEAEGGCVGISEACGLYRKPSPVTSQTLMAQIRKGIVVSYRTTGGQYLVPVWQFRADGGLLEGLAEVLTALRAIVPGNDQLSPFAFFLQPDPSTDLCTPLAALRNGELQKVLKATECYLR